MPVAIRRASHAEAEREPTHVVSNSAADAAPGPSIASSRLDFIQPS